MKELFSIVSYLSAKRFAGLQSDWPKLFFGFQALVRGHINLNAFYSILKRHANKMRDIA